MTGLSVRGLTLAETARALPLVEDVSFSAEAGAVTAILGEAGAGKTVLLTGIAGLRKPLRGAVLVSGADVTKLRPGKRGIAMLPPGTDMGGDRTVDAALRRIAGRGAEPGLLDLLHAFGLSGVSGKRVASLTHGEGFATLAAARLLGAGDVLLVDDAATGLGATAREALLHFVAAQSGAGRTIVLATRDTSMALAADSLVLLNEGRVLQSGAPASVYAEPRDLTAARLTGRMNLLHGIVRQKIPGGFIWSAGGRKFTQLGAGPALGAAVAFCLRPEQMTLAAEGAPGNTLPATVTRLVCLGGRTETWAETALGPVIMHTPGAAQLRRGQLFSLGWEAGAPWPLLDAVPSGPPPAAAPQPMPVPAVPFRAPAKV
jgi:ABC-type Fe3+/spermidine/putrescine transport system ATPase subunit